jgi:hypothetical protein
MQVGDWFVQPYVVGGKPEPENRCVDCAEVVAKVREFRRTNSDPKRELRIHVPSHATPDERAQIQEL